MAKSGLLGKGFPLAERALLQVKALFRPAAAQLGCRPWTSVVGHRGAARRAPENTCRAVQIALSEGASGVEVDVCVTRDGHAVLWHDRDPGHWTAILRQSGLEWGAYVPRVGSAARRPVATLTLEEFLAHHRYVTEMPSAEHRYGALPREVAAEVLLPLAECVAKDDRVRVLLLDIKLAAEEAVLAPALLDTLAAAFSAFPKLRERRVQLLCPQREVYRVLAANLSAHQVLGGVRLSADFELPGVVAIARELRATDVSIGITTRLLWPSVREEVVAAVRARNRGEWSSVTVWTANHEAELSELFRLGVDAVVTDDIPLALSVARLEKVRSGPSPHHGESRR